MAEHNLQPGAPAHGQPAHGHEGARTIWPTEPAFGQIWPRFLGDVPEAIRVQAETCLKGQADLFEGIRDMMAERVKRCQESAAATFRTFERICASRGGSDALAAYGEWLVGSMNLFTADIGALQEEAARLTQIGERMLRAFLPPGGPVGRA